MMSIRRAMIAAQDQLIPPEYQRYDYLQSQGDRAVIDTGVPGDNNNLKFEFCFNVDRLAGSYRGFFSNYSGEAVNCWRFIENPSNTTVIFNTNSKAGAGMAFDTGAYINRKVDITLDKSQLVIKKDGITYTKASPTTAGTANNTTIFINSGARGARTNNDIVKWYFFKIWDGGRLIRNYVPVIRKSDSKAGFYDTVNHTFNPSTGTVDFTAGNDA